MITTDSIKRHLERIKKITKEEIREQISHEEDILLRTRVKDGDYQSLIEYFKGSKSFPKQPSLLAQDLTLLSHKESLKLYHKILDAYGIHNVDRAKEYSSLIENLIFKPKRLSDWKHKKLKFINLTKKNINLSYSYATFILENNWKHSLSKSKHRIIYDNNGNIYWLDNFKEPEYFIYDTNLLCGLSYDHYAAGDKLFIITNTNGTKKLKIDIESINDNFLDSVSQNIEKITTKQQSIDITECFDHGFFYKGPKWKNETPLAPITRIKRLEAERGFLKVIIENVTYPHSGYIILDFKNRKILDSKRL